MDSTRPGIGHNSGLTRDPGHAWRRHCWTKARAGLLGERLPLEVIRRRVARARELGLAYPAYASVLMGSGRDILGFLFTCEGLGLRLSRQLHLDPAVRSQLAALTRCTRLAVAPEAEPPEPFRQELEHIAGTAIAAAMPPPAPSAGWSETRAAVQELLHRENLHRRSVVLIGEGRRQKDWAEAADLARFLPGHVYFAPDRAAP